ncbi:MAG: FAD-dependent oxidoreductase, partial [Polyangiales bacterium]
NLDRHAVKYFKGHGKFVDAHTIEVQPGTRLTTEFALVATGSEPFRPAEIPFDDADVDDSDTILGIDRLPKNMLVLGAGVIGCEYACMFAALGVEVILVDARNEILPFLDKEVAERLRQAMVGLGIDVKLGAKYTKIARTSDTVITCDFDDQSKLEVEKVLFCAGRNGRTKNLGLETIGLQPDKRGAIAVDEHYRTTVPNVYAVGDVIGFPALASTSMEQARVAMVHAFDLGYKKAVGALLPYGIYTVPEVSFVGMTEEEAKKANKDYVVGRAFYRDNARGKIVGDRDGVIKLVVERGTKRLLGVHCIGERAAELVHIGQAIMTLGGGVDTLIEMVFNYPTLSECYKYAAYDALGRLRSE